MIPDALLALLGPALLGNVQGPSRDRLLTQPMRKRLLELIEERPGIHASELCRTAGEPWGTVQYHLSLLSKGEMVTAVATGRERRFFPSGVDPQRARLLAMLTQGHRPEVASFIRDHPGIRQVEVCEALNLSRKTFRSSVDPMLEEGLIQEKRGLQSNRYYPAEALNQLLSPAAAADRIQEQAQASVAPMATAPEVPTFDRPELN